MWGWIGVLVFILLICMANGGIFDAIADRIRYGSKGLSGDKDDDE